MTSANFFYAVSPNVACSVEGVMVNGNCWWKRRHNRPCQSSC